MHKIYPVLEFCCMIGQIDRVSTVNEPRPAIQKIDVGQVCTCAPQMSAIFPKTADFMP